MAAIDRTWFLTWTTYGTWLPGDERGFVSPIQDGPGPEIKHNVFGTRFDADMRGLQSAATRNLKRPPIRLILPQADVIFAQFQETAGYRNWTLLAIGIMRTHIHIVTGVPGDPDPADILGDFKSYASRTLNKRWNKPASGT